MENKLNQLFWERLPKSETPGNKLISAAQVEEFYRIGLVDKKKITLAQWQALCEKLSRQDSNYLLSIEDLNQFKPYLYSGNLRKPFEPMNLKEGPRPLSWLQEFHKKVLHFETTLTLKAWGLIIQEEIQKKFFRNSQLHIDSSFKQFLGGLLQKYSSSLRQLELWIYAPVPEKLPLAAKVSAHKGLPMTDRFDTKATAAASMQRIEKPYYQEPKQSILNDSETLEILAELEALGDAEDSELP